VQQRHHEVTPALALGYVDLELEVETPEGQRAVTIADQVVEWRQERGPRLERSGLDLVQQLDVLRVYVPVAFEAELYGNDLSLGFEVLPDAREPLIAVPDEMDLDLLLRGDAERTQ